jgi:hypothetical protein
MVQGKMIRDDPPPYFHFTLFCNPNCPPAHCLFACKVKYAIEAKYADEGEEDDWAKWPLGQMEPAVHFFASTNNSSGCRLALRNNDRFSTMRVGIEIVWSAHGTWSVNGIWHNQNQQKRKKSIFKFLSVQNLHPYYF